MCRWLTLSTPALVGLVALACSSAAPPPTHTRATALAPAPTTSVTTSVTIGDASASPITFERMAAFPPPGWQIPRAAQWSPDGKLVTYLQSESQSERMALFAYDVARKEHRVILRAEDLTDTSKPMSRAEELRRERQRKRIKGVTGYAWAERAPVMLLPLGGNIFVRAADGSIRQLTDTSTPDIDPKLCSDGTRVAFVRGKELHLVAVASGTERQLTQDAPDGVTRGQSDFNGQEEFGEPSGLWWAPSCDRLAYLEVDERQVDQIPIMGYRQGHDLQHHRYPRSGSTNPTSRLGVIDIATGKTTWIELPASQGWNPTDQYLGRITWSQDGQALFLQRLSRDQRQLALVRADPKTGKARHLVEESDPSWQQFAPMRTLGDGSIVWTAWRDGHRHLERRSGTTGERLAQLTEGAWDVSRLVDVDPAGRRVWFMANRDGVIDRQLYGLSAEGGGAITRVSSEPGVHTISGGRVERGWVDIHSAVDRPPKAVIHGPDGETVGEIDIPQGADSDLSRCRNAKLVTLSQPGKPDLHGALLAPRVTKPGARHPAVVMVYGGPGVQTIRNEYNPRLLWQHLADRGFVVFQVDNRGSTGRGHAFETPIRDRLGAVELEDQLAGLDYLSGLPFVDPDRVGIYGHSYGGTMAALAMLLAPGRFKVGVAGSPVTDWRLYDTGYTERYLGTPQGNPNGYAASEVSQHAAKLRGKLFIIHALMDENVHFQHTAKLIDGLVQADKDFDLLLFPGERHGYRNPKARRYLYRRVVDYLVANL
jgi:dipeptidyl-peptidase-4